MQNKFFVSLIKCGLTDAPVAAPSTDVDWNEILRVSEAHSVSALVWYGIRNSSIEVPEAAAKRFKAAVFRSVLKDEKQTSEIKAVCMSFEESNVDYMPLKGVLLKPLYPDPVMRAMGDADILIRVEQNQAASEIMEKQGFRLLKESAHEYIWSKPPVFIELHKMLISPHNKDYFAYYGNGWDFAVKESEGCRYRMKNEDEFVFLFTHFSKHYRDGGIGIRHLVDLFVFRNAHPDLDDEYIRAELTKLRLHIFFENVLKTLECWFGKGEWDAITDLITDRTLESGSYGTHQAKVFAAAAKEEKAGNARKGRIKKLLYLCFLPLDKMKVKYPILNRAPVLLPALWVSRIFGAVIFKRGKVASLSGDIAASSSSNIDNYRNELETVGLDFGIYGQE